MLLHLTTLLLAIAITTTNSLITDRKVSLISIGELLVLFSVLLLINYLDYTDFPILYSSLGLFIFSNILFRKRNFQSTNVVSTIFMLTFVISQIPIYLYQMFLSRGTIERVVDSYVSTSAIIIFSMIVVFIMYRLTIKLINQNDEFINARLTIYNIIVLLSIIAVDRFIVNLSVLDDFYFETVILMFITIMLFIVFLYLSMYILQKMNVVLENLSKENINTQDRAINAFRKNHNTTNLLLTVNYLLKEQEYDKALQYIQKEK